MSTTGKLNPRVREARHRRKAAVIQLSRLGLQGQAIAVPLDGLRRMSHLTGEQKERAFERAMHQLPPSTNSPFKP
jgi:hypothetical protein